MAHWKEGKYLDIWSISHFLSGVSFAGWMFFLKFDALTILLSYFALALLWEAFEIFKGVNEDKRNRIIDILVGLIGFLFVLLILDENSLFSQTWLLIFSVIYVLMGIYGYINYRIKKEKN